MCDLQCWSGLFYEGLVLFNIAVGMTCVGILVAALVYFYLGGGPPGF
jgi:hypothetical protein